jgi:hypothetical protein
VSAALRAGAPRQAREHGAPGRVPHQGGRGAGATQRRARGAQGGAGLVGLLLPGVRLVTWTHTTEGVRYLTVFLLLWGHTGCHRLNRVLTTK